MLELPRNLSERLGDSDWREIGLGMSRAQVYCLTAPDARRCYLKTDTLDKNPEPLRFEAERLQWLKGRLPVPEVLAFEEQDGREFMLLSEIPGTDLSAAHESCGIDAMVDLAADALQRVHAVDISGCPFDHSIAMRLPEVMKRLKLGMVDADDFDEERQGKSPFDVYRDMMLIVPEGEEDLVFTHGDYCLPNIIAQDGKLSGFVDLGRAGVADRYQDVALCARSIAHNYGEAYVAPFLERYGTGEPDMRKLEFYRTLDEFF